MGEKRREREDHTALVEKGERTAQLWQSGNLMAATQLMVPEPESWTPTSFSEIRYPRLAEGEGRTVCICGYSKGL